ncbi:glutathione S-transferase Mu 4-like isoform X2 [Sorex araneus]|uniref:glutathione S-transferase Mu 4-like isoform X2 n=1 Tax=Sorex araneus TaxID=42254 RepID=UPI0024340351|nr:glutathione S-transferase Mu 4-like isoform X2 [Sorex araneus]
MTVTLGYWDIRGLAHAIRLLLEYTDSNYVEKLYSMGDAPDYDRSQWLDEKFKLGFDFPNLPYLIDGPHKITQSNAILRYLARKHNLCGETEEEKIRVDILENQAMDTANDLARVCYSPDFLTYVDFLAYDVLDLHRVFEPTCLDAFSNLQDFISRVQGLKKISAYMQSPRFRPHPIYTKVAVWGNK